MRKTPVMKMMRMLVDGVDFWARNRADRVGQRRRRAPMGRWARIRWR